MSAQPKMIKESYIYTVISLSLFNSIVEIRCIIFLCFPYNNNNNNNNNINNNNNNKINLNSNCLYGMKPVYKNASYKNKLWNYTIMYIIHNYYYY